MLEFVKVVISGILVLYNGFKVSVRFKYMAVTFRKIQEYHSVFPKTSTELDLVYSVVAKHECKEEGEN